jgi:hypothetical protein
MILNAYAVLDVFLALLRLLVGLLVIGLALAAWQWHRRGDAPEDRKALEDSNYLLSLLTLLLLGLNLASWPLLYLLLQSYVSQWPGVMCIYGVTQVGARSVGSSRFLPGLLATLQALKPVEVFCNGAWFLLYWLNRHTRTGPLLSQLFLVLVACGALAVADAGVEVTYLLLPKKEEILATGCCAGVFEEQSSLWAVLTSAVSKPERLPWLYGTFYGTNLAMLATLFGLTRGARPLRAFAALVPLLLGALVTLGVGAVFLVEVVAPKVLHLPYHHCPYDLIPRAPDVLVGVAFFVWGTFSVGWAWIAARFARCPETQPFLGKTIERVLFMALCCYLGSVVLMSVELALA